MASTPQPPAPSQESASKSLSKDEASRAQAIHAASILCVVACPIILALPPRKLDIYTIALLSGTVMGGNQLVQDYTGRGILARIAEWPTRKQPLPSSAHDAAVEKDKEALLGRKAFERGIDAKDGLAARINGEAPATNTRILEELRRKKETDERITPKDVLENRPAQTNKPKWKQERDKREKEAFAAGRGYGDLIMDQIWEVWNGGKPQPNDAKTADEKAVEAKEEKGNK